MHEKMPPACVEIKVAQTSASWRSEGLLSAPDHASGCPELRPAPPANQPPSRAATALFSSRVGACAKSLAAMSSRSPCFRRSERRRFLSSWLRVGLGLGLGLRSGRRPGFELRLAYLVEAVPPDDEAEEDAFQRGGLGHVRAADPLARLRRPLVADHAEHLGCHDMRYVQNARGLYHA